MQRIYWNLQRTDSETKSKRTSACFFRRISGKRSKIVQYFFYIHFDAQMPWNIHSNLLCKYNTRLWFYNHSYIPITLNKNLYPTWMVGAKSWFNYFMSNEKTVNTIVIVWISCHLFCLIFSIFLPNYPRFLMGGELTDWRPSTFQSGYCLCAVQVWEYFDSSFICSHPALQLVQWEWTFSSQTEY